MDFGFKGFKQVGYIPYSKVLGKQTFITPPGKEYFLSKEEAIKFASKTIRTNLKRLSMKDRKAVGIITTGVREIDI